MWHDSSLYLGYGQPALGLFGRWGNLYIEMVHFEFTMTMQFGIWDGLLGTWDGVFLVWDGIYKELSLHPDEKSESTVQLGAQLFESKHPKGCSKPLTLNWTIPRKQCLD